jgi:thiamine kinase-like enzyme
MAEKLYEGRQSESGLAYFEKALALLAGRDSTVIIQRYLAAKNITLIHGDLHPGNMFISTNDRSVRMIDLEAMRMGACTDDLAMLMAFHIAPCKQEAMPLLRHYHMHLVKSVNNYSFDEFISDYCVSILENMFFSISLINQGIPAFNLRDASLEAFKSFMLKTAL